MGFDRNLSVKERIRKRRRQKRVRSVILIIVFVSILAFVAFRSGALRHDDEDPVFSDKEPVTTVESTGSTPEVSPGVEGAVSSTSYNAEVYPGSFPDQSSKETTAEENNTGESNTGIEENKQENPDYDVFVSELKEYISQYKGQYGIYYIDLADDYEFGINDTDEYIAASTVKVPLNLYLYKKIAEGKVNPEGTLTYNPNDKEGGTGILINNKDLTGKSFTVRYLSKISITHSDNIATNMLLRYLGRKNLKNYMRFLGGDVVQDNKNVSCPKDMALYLKNVYEFCNNNEELGKELKSNLCNTVFNERLPKLLPKEVEVAHKIGNQIQALHDVGIIYTDKPYILAVMSKDVNEAEAYDVIANISKMTYDFVKDR